MFGRLEENTRCVNYLELGIIRFGNGVLGIDRELRRVNVEGTGSRSNENGFFF